MFGAKYFFIVFRQYYVFYRSILCHEIFACFPKDYVSKTMILFWIPCYFCSIRNYTLITQSFHDMTNFYLSTMVCNIVSKQQIIFLKRTKTMVNIMIIAKYRHYSFCYDFFLLGIFLNSLFILLFIKKLNKINCH